MTLPGYKFLYVIPFFTIIILLLSCGPGKEQPEMLELSGITMGTTYNIKVKSRIPENIQDGIRIDVAGILENLDNRMSTYIPESELTQINRNNITSRQIISDDLYRVIAEALYVSRLTDGAFDITIGPLVNLWGFGPMEKDIAIPPNEAIKAELVKTGFKNLDLQPESRSLLKKIPGLYIDLSGIAKGYAVDKVAEYLDNSGYTDYMVEIGGEIRAAGLNASQQPWNIGIEKPVPGIRSVQRAVPLRNMAMATSGDYRNFFEIDGIRYSHTIDPRTGTPVHHNLISVTVLNPSASIADALATGLLVLGPVAADKVAQEHNIAAYFMVRNGEGFEESVTPAFKTYLDGGSMQDP